MPTKVVFAKNMSLLRGAAILCVLFNHATLCVLHDRSSTDWGAERAYGLFERMALTVGVTLPIAAIAGFMIVSGYFMGRFSSTWPATKAVVKTIGLRYACWSLFGFIALAVITQDVTPTSIAERLLVYFGPFPAYWYFSSLLLFSLLCPILTRWAARSPFSLLAFFLGLETLRAILFYGRGSLLPTYLLPLQGTYFILGVLLSQHATAVIDRLKPYRRHILAAATILLIASFVETSLWWRDSAVPSGKALVSDRLTVRLYSVLISSWLILRDTRQSRFVSLIEAIGMRSSAIFLSMDLFMWLAGAVIWHLPSLFSEHALVHIEGAPSYLGYPAWVPFYFLIGLFAPLCAVAIAERLGGKRLRVAIFG